jgi:hypothetical protein
MSKAWLASLLVVAAFFGASLEAQTPLLHYKFNETSGTVATNSGTSGVNGNFSSAPTWFQPGQIGTGAVNDPANVEMPTGLSPAASLAGGLTIEFWVRTTTTVACGIVGSNSLTIGQLCHFIILSSGEISLIWDSAGGYMQLYGQIPVNNGAWHHVALTVGGGTPLLYIDAQADTLTPFTGPPGTYPLTVTATQLMVFDNSVAGLGTGWGAFTGDMDEFRCWNVVRSASEIGAAHTIEWGQTATEINVKSPSGANVASNSTHRVDPVLPGSTTTLSWTIENVVTGSTLNIGTISVNAITGCSVAITTNPSSTAIAGGSSATLSIQITANAALGNIQFTINIPNDDSNENPYFLTVDTTRGMSGALTIDNSGAGNYMNFGLAFDDLENFGVAGNLTFTVLDNGSGYQANSSYELGSDAGTTPSPMYAAAGTTTTFVASSGVRPVISGNFTLNLFGATAFGIATMMLTDTRGALRFEGLDFTGTTDANFVIFRDSALPGGGTVRITRCKFHTNFAGMGFYAIGNGIPLTGVTLDNNFFWDHVVTTSTFYTGLTIPSAGIISLFNGSPTCSVEHNTVALTPFGSPAADANCFDITGAVSDLGALRYNVFTTVTTGTKVVSIPAALEPQVSDRNVFYFPTGIGTFSALYADLNAWRTANPTLDPNSVDTDPLLVSATDLHISNGSSADDLAVGSTATVDIDGTARGANPDSGADEMVPAPELEVSRASTVIASAGTDTITGTVSGTLAAVTYDVENIGTALLTFTGATPVGVTPATGAPTVSVAAQPPATLAASGGTGTFTINVTPTTVGPWTANVTIASNDPASPYTFTMSGTAASTTPDLEVSRNSVSVAHTTTDTVTGTMATVLMAVTYDATNLGASLLTFTGGTPVGVTPGTGAPTVSVAAQPPATLAASGGTGTFTINVTPNSAGAWTANVTIASNDPASPYTFTMSGNAAGAPAPEINVQRPTGTDIPDNTQDNVAGTTAGTPTTLTYNLQNIGNGTLTMTGAPIVVSGQTNCTAVVTGAQPGLTLNAFTAVTFTIDVTPTSATTWDFDIDIASNDSDEPNYDIFVTGTASGTPVQDINVQRPAGTNIADGGTDTVTGTVVATLTPLTYTVQNVGTATLNLIGANPVTISSTVNCTAVISGAQPGPTIVATGASAFNINLTPAATGGWSFQIDIASDDPDEANYDILVTGTASATSAPEITVLKNGTINITDGGTDSQTGTGVALFSVNYTIRNDGAATLNLTGGAGNEVSVSGSVNCLVGVTQPGSSSIAPSGTTTFSIQVTPTAAGTFSFVVTIANDDANENPYNWTFNGNTASGGGGGGAGGGGGGGGGGCSNAGSGQGWLALVGLLGLLTASTRLRKRRA